MSDLCGWAIYKGDLRTGEGMFLYPNGRSSRWHEGRQTNELSVRLWRPYWNGKHLRCRTGEFVAAIQLTDIQPTFINDVVPLRMRLFHRPFNAVV
jgi:hypothetical protein